MPHVLGGAGEKARKDGAWVLAPARCCVWGLGPWCLALPKGPFFLFSFAVVFWGVWRQTGQLVPSRSDSAPESGLPGARGNLRAGRAGVEPAPGRPGLPEVVRWPPAVPPPPCLACHALWLFFDSADSVGVGVLGVFQQRRNLAPLVVRRRRRLCEPMPDGSPPPTLVAGRFFPATVAITVPPTQRQMG